MKKIYLGLAAFTSLTIGTAQAQCPVCTVAAIGGVGLARWLKIDDTITGIWIGGLLVSVSLWTINWLKAKKWRFWQDNIIVPLFYYLTTIIPLYTYKIIGHPGNLFWKMDKLVLGIIIGSIFFMGITLKYQEIKQRNNGRAQFPFQKVVLPVLTLSLLSLIFYFLTK